MGLESKAADPTISSSAKDVTDTEAGEVTIELEISLSSVRVEDGVSSSSIALSPSPVL